MTETAAVIYCHPGGVLKLLRREWVEVVADECAIQHSERDPALVGQPIAAFRDNHGTVWHQDPVFDPSPVSEFGIGSRWTAVHFEKEARGVDAVTLRRID